MKDKRRTLVSLVVVVGVALVFTGAVASADDRPGKQTLAGVWLGELTLLSACGGVPVQQFPALITFTRDGKVIETPATPSTGNPATVRTSPGLGSWQHEKGQHFSAVFRFFQITVPTNLPAGSATLTQAIELDQDGDSYALTGTADFFDASGNFLVRGCHTETATRLE